MGICPCPRCTIQKESFYALGTTGDTADRNSKVRRDNDNFRSIVQEARDNIYRKGYALQSEQGVERLLKKESFVPTLVSNFYLGCIVVLLAHFNTRTHSHIPSRTSTSISSSPLLSTSCMSSSSEYGRPSSLILYGFSILWVQIKFRSSILGMYTYSHVVLVPDPPVFEVPRNCAI